MLTPSLQSVGGSAAVFFPSTHSATQSIRLETDGVLPERILPPQYYTSQPSTSQDYKVQPDRRRTAREHRDEEKEDVPETFPVQSPQYSTSSDLVASCANHARFMRDHSRRNPYGTFEMADGKKFAGTSRRGALFCRSGTWLEIIDDREAERQRRKYQLTFLEQVRGNSQENGRFSILEFISVAIGLVSIRGVEANRYLCMDSESRMYAAHPRNYSSECVFLEEMMENYYNLYSSCAHGTRAKPWYIALKRTGRPRRGKHSRKRRKASHFLVVHFDSGIVEAQTKERDMGQLVMNTLMNRPIATGGSEPIFRIPQTIKPRPLPKRPNKPKTTVSPITREERQERERKKKRRREDRLRRERQERERRMREIEDLRRRELIEQEIRMYRSRGYRLSGAGLKIAARTLKVL